MSFIDAQLNSAVALWASEAKKRQPEAQLSESGCFRPVSRGKPEGPLKKATSSATNRAVALDRFLEGKLKVH